jgi:predicted phosphodiesterase
MKVGIITDTHDLHDVLQKAIDVFTEYQVDYILHAGDITSPSTAYTLASTIPAISAKYLLPVIST